ncbi:hypothetical protein BDV19DRAFT_14458 [Aspergillus venezuelensis]
MGPHCLPPTVTQHRPGEAGSHHRLAFPCLHWLIMNRHPSIRLFSFSALVYRAARATLSVVSRGVILQITLGRIYRLLLLSGVVLIIIICSVCLVESIRSLTVCFVLMPIGYMYGIAIRFDGRRRGGRELERDLSIMVDMLGVKVILRYLAALARGMTAAWGSSSCG